MSASKEFSKWIAQARVDVRSNTDIRKYLSSGSEMLRQANVYRGEKDIVRAYFMYTKYTSLFLEDLRKHPDYANVPKAEQKSISRNVKQVLEEAEKLKEPAVQAFNQNALERAKAEPSLPPKLDDTPGSEAEFESPTFYSSGVREILVPVSLIPKFLELARTNTEKNIETCGLLTGTLQQNRLTISVLIIPQQTGSSDDCVAENDIDTFNVIDQRGLLSFGWIHTHPTQKAFLSSVDLHSQFGYQAMMPEALAIVCAPKYSNEIFRLTDMGLVVVGQCTQRGFHPHSESPLFENAAHAQIRSIPCEVVDLRKR